MVTPNEEQKKLEVSFEPETTRDRNDTENLTMCCKRIIALKYSHIFSMGYNFKCHENTFYLLTIQTTCLKLKK